MELNGEPLANLAIGMDSESHRFLLPEPFLKEENQLVFHLPGARSPKSLGLSDDVRRLGIGLEWLVLEEAW